MWKLDSGTNYPINRINFQYCKAIILIDGIGDEPVRVEGTCHRDLRGRRRVFHLLSSSHERRGEILVGGRCSFSYIRIVRASV